METKASRMEDGTNDITEARALVSRIKLATSFQVKNLIIEGDSMNIVNTLKKIESLNWYITYILHEAWHLSPLFDKYRIVHCYR